MSIDYIIILPTYNEAKNIRRLSEQIFRIEPDFHILIVDDNSPDGTGDIAESMAREDTRIQVIHRPAKMGLGTAYVQGFKHVLKRGAQYIFQMDADLSHSPEYLPDFLKAIQNADMVIGSRYINGVRVEGWPFRRLLLSKAANVYTACMLVKPVSDFTAGFRCYRREVLEAMDLDAIHSEGYGFQIETAYLTFKNGFRVREIPIMFREREQGVSKLSKNIFWESLFLVWRLRAPLFKIFKHLVWLVRGYSYYIEEYYNNGKY